jgi:uncharacterized membrane protein
MLSDPTMVAVSANRGPAYDLVLLAHVLVAVTGFGTVAVAGAYARLLGRPGERTPSVVRYYRPGVNWAGRTLFGVPVLGFVLLWMSHGAWSLSDEWVLIGLSLWTVAATVGETVLWPAERRLQQLVAQETAETAEIRRLRHRVMGCAAGMLAVFLVVMVVMVAKP